MILSSIEGMNRYIKKRKKSTEQYIIYKGREDQTSDIDYLYEVEGV